MPRVFVSIGSNIDKARNIGSGVAALSERFGALVVSSVYESEAVGFAGDNFYNLVVAFDTDEPLDTVVAELDRVENEHGRVRNGERFNNRTLDLDILLYGDLVRHDADVDIPRSEITRYAFVLAPLAEIAPAGRHPELHRTYAELAEDLGEQARTAWKVPFKFG